MMYTIVNIWKYKAHFAITHCDIFHAIGAYPLNIMSSCTIVHPTDTLCLQDAVGTLYTFWNISCCMFFQAWPNEHVPKFYQTSKTFVLSCQQISHRFLQLIGVGLKLQVRSHITECTYYTPIYTCHAHTHTYDITENC